MEYHKQVVDEGRAPEQVRVVGVPLGAIHEGPEPVDLHQPEAAQDRVKADGQIEEVQRQQAQAVDVEDRRVHVVGAQLQSVRLQHPVLQVSGAKVEQYIDQIQEVGQVVQTEPNGDRSPIDLLEGEAVDYHPEVVQEGHGHHHGPVVAQSPRRIKDEVQFPGRRCCSNPLRGRSSWFLVVRLATMRALSTTSPTAGATVVRVMRMAAVGGSRPTRATLRGWTVCVRVVRHRGCRVLQLVGVVRLLGGIVVPLLLRSGARVAIESEK